jgi:quercetin dioxygenase-like cupin family protein
MGWFVSGYYEPYSKYGGLQKRLKLEKGSTTRIFMARIVKRKDAPKLETVKGRHGEILMAGEKCMMMINTIEPGLPTPPHSHPHEQIGYLQEGEGDLYIGDEKIHLKAQCSFVAPGGVPHNFDATGDKPAVLIECFAPPREDYLERVAKDTKKK